ncbi:MAG: hypothetical protein WCS95_00930 [Lentisphaeria bacterium]
MSRPQKPAPPMEYIASAYKNCMDFFFPDFWEKVDQIEDPRVAGRCIYTLRQLLGTELARCFSAIESHRLMDSLFSRPGTAEGISQLCGEAGETVPRGDTINYSLAKMQPQYLHSMIDDMAFVLLAGKRLERCREPLASTILLALDGSGLHCRVIPLPHSTTRKHRDGSRSFHNYVLLLAFVSQEGIIIPVACEFVENSADYNPEFDKQDCEYKAIFKSLSQFKQKHRMLPVTTLIDAIAISYPILDLHRKNGWYYCFSYKAGVVVGMDKDIARLLEDPQCRRKETIESCEDGTTIIRTYRWVELLYDYGMAKEKGEIPVRLRYTDMTVTVINKEKEVVSKQEYRRLTNHKLNDANIDDFFAYIGRARWVEENEGFNEMKNLGLEIEHAYGYKEDCIINHFLIAMIAFIIMQLAQKTDFFEKMISEAGLCGFSKKTRELFGGLIAIARHFCHSLQNHSIILFDMQGWRIKWNTS